MVIAPANILISDAGGEWMKVGVPLVLQQDLMSSQNISPAMVSDETNVSEVGAQDILRLKVEDRQGKIHVAATVVDVKTQKTTATEDVDAPSIGALIPALNKLAKRIDPSAGEFSTKNTDALKQLAAAGTEEHPQERYELLKKTVVTDPNFGMAYFMLLQMMASAPPDTLKQTLDEAQAHMPNFPPYERARLQLLIAQLKRAPLSQRTTAVEALLKVAPNDLDALSMIGGVRFLNGDVSGGIETLNKAVRLNPGNLNLKAQLAQGLVQSKRFADAEKLLASFDKTPAAKAELAQTILLEGDVKRATETLEKFAAGLPTPDFQVLVRAAWSKLCGDQSKALALAETTKFAKPELSSMALSEATVWRLMEKDFAGAQKIANAVAKPDAHQIDVITSLLVMGNQSPQDWIKKVQAAPVNPALKEPIVAYGLFLNGHYNEAADEWRKAYESTEGADLKVRTMYAASLDRAGKKAEAEKIKVQPFLIRDFADVFGAVAFTEMRRLTGLTK
jgi:tetratricopeptide (TPR) repeat protein